MGTYCADCKKCYNKLMATNRGTTLGLIAGGAAAWGALHFGIEADSHYWDGQRDVAAVTCLTDTTPDSPSCWQYTDTVQNYQQEGHDNNSEMWKDLAVTVTVALGGAACSIAAFRMRP